MSTTARSANPRDVRTGLEQPSASATFTYAVQYGNGEQEVRGTGAPAFTLIVSDKARLDAFVDADAFSAAMSYLRGEVDIRGDMVAAVRFKKTKARSCYKHLLYKALAVFVPSLTDAWFQTRSRAARNVRFHYDRSNDFYKQFLDPRLVYSCAYFKNRDWSLEQAQVAKLDLICRKLQLQAGERLLDVGCGWGAFVLHAADEYGATATGCTLSRRQHEYAQASTEARGLQNRVSIQEIDFRDVQGRFHKIASISMFEQVGRHRLRSYFQKMCDLLEDGGLFMNHGIVRPQFVSDDYETLFLQRKVFPGGEFAHLSDVIREAENSGLEVLDVENLRPHYAMTCRAWVQNLQRNAQTCLKLVDRETYRTWVLYLAASALSFDEGLTDVYQILLAKRTAGRTYPLSRDYMYQ